MSEDSSRAVWLQQARSYLRNADPVLARLIDDRPAFDPRAWLAQLPPMDLYGAVLHLVTSRRAEAATTDLRQIATASSSNATARRRLTGSSMASS